MRAIREKIFTFSLPLPLRLTNSPDVPRTKKTARTLIYRRQLAIQTDALKDSSLFLFSAAESNALIHLSWDVL